eukprot:CAMPEP_0172782264 /NCGR_PEP_ID=MMETSP1074-20121228/203847_1 /TAXON_ID=2916 /ORGANISM="Ceratium fusus, Strain PA161109" /LENGTH=193 /DNA_ID=CAMNT_0013619247 /DNA_START=1268 /DNA_END=1850 /DNA_ORIENTATION=-
MATSPVPMLGRTSSLASGRAPVAERARALALVFEVAFAFAFAFALGIASAARASMSTSCIAACGAGAFAADAAIAASATAAAGSADFGLPRPDGSSEAICLCTNTEGRRKALDDSTGSSAAHRAVCRSASSISSSEEPWSLLPQHDLLCWDNRVPKRQLCDPRLQAQQEHLEEFPQICVSHVAQIVIPKWYER